jgi:hypothetical protein
MTVLIWVEVSSEALLVLLGLLECRVVPADLGPMVVPDVGNHKVVSALGLTLLNDIPIDVQSFEKISPDGSTRSSSAHT